MYLKIFVLTGTAGGFFVAEADNKNPSVNRKGQTINKPLEIGVCFYLPKGERKVDVEYKIHRDIEK